MSTRILVVDDAALFRRAISDALASVPGVEVVGAASNGRLALAHIDALRPDLITLDLEMPEMDGLRTLEALRASGRDTGVIVLSAQSRSGGEQTVRALELGAFDFVTKPEGGSVPENIERLRACLLPIVRAFQRLRRSPVTAPATASTAAAPILPSRPPVSATPAPGVARMVLIGVSTGGPRALATLLPALPATLRVPVFIVQHMPPLFTEPLAARLAAQSGLPVREAADGEIAMPGRAYLAPGGRHMKLGRGPRGEIVTRITDEAPENNCKPAVDVLFRSAALHFPGAAVAAILTGMGSDGTHGLRLLRRAGCYSLAQDEASSVVFGMNKSVIDAGLVDHVAPLDQLAPAIVRAVGPGSGGGAT